MAKRSAAELPAHPITVRAHRRARTRTRAAGGGAARRGHPHIPPGGHGWSLTPAGASQPGWSPAAPAGARTLLRDVVAAHTPLLMLHSHFRGHVRGADGEPGGRLRGPASGCRWRRGGREVGEEARRAKEDGKRLARFEQQGLTAVRRFSAG